MTEYNNLLDDSNPTKNGWNRWAQWIIMEIKRLDTIDKEIVGNIKTLNKELMDEIKTAHKELKEDIESKFDEIKTSNANELKELREIVKANERDIQSLKIRAAVWGALAGLVPVVIGIVIEILTFTKK